MPSGIPHEPTKETRQTVYDLASFGIPQSKIAKHIRLDEKTLMKHYAQELETAAINRNAEVANVLFKKATVDEEMSAIIFWLKTRAGWRETKREDGKDTVIEQLVKQLSDAAKNK